MLKTLSKRKQSKTVSKGNKMLKDYQGAHRQLRHTERLSTVGTTFVRRVNTSEEKIDLSSSPYLKARFYITLSKSAEGSYRIVSCGNLMVTGHFDLPGGTHPLPISPIADTRYADCTLIVAIAPAADDVKFEVFYDELEPLIKSEQQHIYYHPVTEKVYDAVTTQLDHPLIHRFPLHKLVIVSPEKLKSAKLVFEHLEFDLDYYFDNTFKPDETFVDDNIVIGPGKNTYVFNCHDLSMVRYEFRLHATMEKKSLVQVYMILSQWNLVEAGLVGPWM